METTTAGGRLPRPTPPPLPTHSADQSKDWCSQSLAQCMNCGGDFCRDDGLTDPAPTPEPTFLYSPTVAPPDTSADADAILGSAAPLPDLPADKYCCYYSHNHSDRCGSCSSFNAASNWCSTNQHKCEDCGGHFCPAQPTHTPTPSPTLDPTPGPPAYEPTVAPADPTPDTDGP